VTVFAVLVLSALTLIALSSSGSGSSAVSDLRSGGSTLLSPVVNVVNTVTRPVGQFFAGAINYGAVNSENAKLRAQLGAIQERGLVQTYERRQVAEIAALQHLTFVGSIPTVTAQTTSLDASNFAATIEISKGTDEGVGVGMPVVGGGGLVGQVVTASATSATVRLVTDGATHIGASIGPASILGVVNGVAAGRPLTVSYVAPQSQVAKGMVVYTNGLQGAQYPAGIPIGKVTSATSPPNAVQMSISLVPMANLDKIAYVDVLLWNQVP
jgi:rod shape-determining protein MreC